MPNERNNLMKTCEGCQCEFAPSLGRTLYGQDNSGQAQPIDLCDHCLDSAVTDDIIDVPESDTLTSVEFMGLRDWLKETHSV